MRLGLRSVLVVPVLSWLVGTVAAATFLPVAEWSGRLVLPSVDERQDDGSVPIVIENAPDRSFVGRTMRLRWDAQAPFADWFDQVRVDVTIDEKLGQQASEGSWVIPRRLDGWKRVSPLESLAGARPVDDMRVMLRSPRVDGDDLFVGTDPVQVEGTHRTLATFRGPARGDRRTVVPFNPASGAFDGEPFEVVVAATTPDLEGKRFPRASTVAIEDQPLNADGWYMDGHLEDGTFHVDALSPRRLFLLRPDAVAQGEGAVKKYVDDVVLANLQVGTTLRSAYAPSDADTTDRDAYAAGQWPVGRRALLLHLFGGRRSEDGTWKRGVRSFGIVSGHFSFGVATVVRCPFTGETRFDVEYRQVYAHNAEGIVSGAQTWAAYMGSMQRGWMWPTVIVDTIVHVPELEPFDLGGTVYRPLDGALASIEKMTAVYRTGNGGGVSAVSGDVSCVQDSNCALYGALAAFERRSSGDDDLLGHILNLDEQAPDVQRFRRLQALVGRIRRSITIFGITTGQWRGFLHEPLGTRDPNAWTVKMLVRSIIALKTVFPRRGNDNLLRLAAEYDYPMWSLRSVRLGGDIPGLQALAPTSLLIR